MGKVTYLIWYGLPRRWSFQKPFTKDKKVSAKNKSIFKLIEQSSVVVTWIYHKSVTNLLPKSIAIHILVVITEWSVRKRATLQVHVI